MPRQFLRLAVGSVVSFSVGRVSRRPRGTAFQTLGKGLPEGLPVALFLRVASRRALPGSESHRPGICSAPRASLLEKLLLIFA